MTRIVESPSPNHGPRPAGAEISVLVLHYTGMDSARAAIDRLRDPDAGVSSHWLVDEDGTLHAMVPENRRAWHAGVSAWRGRENVNDVSVGVEIVNPGHEHGYRPFPPAQMAAVTALCHGILARHPIPPRNVVAHSDIAPARKIDPGELFDWPGLAAAGIGLWPDLPAMPDDDDPVDPATFRELLQRFGYPDLPESIAAFQRRFRPARIDGQPDRACLARLVWLVERAGT